MLANHIVDACKRKGIFGLGHGPRPRVVAFFACRDMPNYARLHGNLFHNLEHTKKACYSQERNDMFERQCSLQPNRSFIILAVYIYVFWPPTQRSNLKNVVGRPGSGRLSGNPLGQRQRQSPLNLFPVFDGCSRVPWCSKVYRTLV